MDNQEGSFKDITTTWRQQLSACPVTTLELQKKELFPEGHKFPTVDDIEVPENVSTETIMAGLTEAQKEFQSVVLSVIEDPSKLQTEHGLEKITPLTELSAGVFVTTDEKQKMFIEHMEMIKTVPLDSITIDNAQDIIRKVAYSMLKVLKTKTIK